MENYKLISNLGSGSYGTVCKAVDRRTNEVVAIKRLKRKYHSTDECLRLPEVRSLRRLNNHPNIVKLKEFIFENSEAFFVFEHMDINLSQLIRYKQEPFSEAEVRRWMSQLLQALEYMHMLKYFHRDLKPENMLVSKDVLKVADLGMAREMNQFFPSFTSGVTTLWYRAPEVLLQSKNYGAPIDMWAAGAIMAELITCRPLFPGRNEISQLHQICAVLGAPTEHTWANGMKMAASFNFKFSQTLSPTPLSKLRNASPAAIDLISALCSWDPCKRPTASQALQHPFFQTRKQIVPVPFFQQGCQSNLPPIGAELVQLGKHGTRSTVNKRSDDQARFHDYSRNFVLQQSVV